MGLLLTALAGASVGGLVVGLWVKAKRETASRLAAEQSHADCLRANAELREEVRALRADVAELKQTVAWLENARWVREGGPRPFDPEGGGTPPAA